MPYLHTIRGSCLTLSQKYCHQKFLICLIYHWINCCFDHSVQCNWIIKSQPIINVDMLCLMHYVRIYSRILRKGALRKCEYQLPYTGVGVFNCNAHSIQYVQCCRRRLACVCSAHHLFKLLRLLLLLLLLLLVVVVIVTLSMFTVYWILLAEHIWLGMFFFFVAVQHSFHFMCK